MHPDRTRWNAKYRAGLHPPLSVRLIMHLGRLTPGMALDVAAGIGENASVLALRGWRVVAADLSDEAVARARRRASELKADLHVVQADATRLPFRHGAFDTVVCTYFLDRSVPLADYLRPGGTLFVESFTTDQIRYSPTFRRDFCYEPGELRRGCEGLDVLLYEETDNGRDATALLIARKPV